jgi:ParB/RepB/Spo0J family partition protein
MNISQTETLLLAEIGRREIEGLPLAVTEIAEALGIGQPSASKFAKRMAEKDGWITRAPLALTPAGKAVMATAPAVLIPHDRIAPGANPRHMDLREGGEDIAALRDLAESIADKGQLQPILVRPVANGGYDIVGGERRWRATALLITEGRLPEEHPVAATVRPLSDEDAMVAALAENMARRDMNPMDEAEGLFSVYGPRVDAAPEGERRKAQAETVALLAKATGQSDRYIQARIRLARDLPQSVRTMVRLGELGVTFANELVSWPQVEQEQAAGRIAARAPGWTSVEEIRAQRKGADAPPPTPVPAMPPEAIRAAEAVALAEASGKTRDPAIPAMATEIPESEPNRHGVYEPTVTYTVVESKSPRVSAAIRMARCEDGLIRFSFDIQNATRGHSGPITIGRDLAFPGIRNAHFAALRALRDRFAKIEGGSDAEARGAELAMAMIGRFAAAWEIDLDGGEDLDAGEFSARGAVIDENPEPASGPTTDKDTARVVGPECDFVAGDGTDCRPDSGTAAPSPSGDTWPSDPEAATVTDRQVLHDIGRALSMGAIRIVIEADPLARSTAAELMARIAATQDDGAVQIKTGGQRAIVSGRR